MYLMVKKIKMQPIIFIGTILIYIVMLLIKNNTFVFPEAIQLNIVLVLLILFIILLIFMNFLDSISALFVSNFLLFFTLLSLPTVVNPNFFTSHSKPLSFYLVFFLIVLFIFIINTLVITIKLISQKEPVLYKSTKYKNNIIFKGINYFLYLIDLLLYKIRFMFPILAYMITIIIIILTFAILYEGNSIYSEQNTTYEGLFYGQLDENNNIVRVNSFDHLYYSTSIFLNNNDGDIKPIGDTIKLLVQFEMLIGHISNIIYIPTLLFLFLKLFDEKQSLIKSESRSRIYKNSINIKNSRKRRYY